LLSTVRLREVISKVLDLKERFEGDKWDTGGEGGEGR